MAFSPTYKFKPTETAKKVGDHYVVLGWLTFRSESTFNGAKLLAKGYSIISVEWEPKTDTLKLKIRYTIKTDSFKTAIALMHYDFKSMGWVNGD